MAKGDDLLGTAASVPVRAGCELLPAFASSFLIHSPQPKGSYMMSKGVYSGSPCPMDNNMEKKLYITIASHPPSVERGLLGDKVKCAHG